MPSSPNNQVVYPPPPPPPDPSTDPRRLSRITPPAVAAVPKTKPAQRTNTPVHRVPSSKKSNPSERRVSTHEKRTLRMKRRETYQKLAGVSDQDEKQPATVRTTAGLPHISEYQLDNSEMIKLKKKLEKEQNALMRDRKADIESVEKELKETNKTQLKQFDLSLVTIKDYFKIKKQSLEFTQSDFLNKWKEQNQSVMIPTKPNPILNVIPLLMFYHS